VDGGHEDWRRDLFEALTTRRVSRNRFPEAFAQGWSRDVHRRFQTLRALERDAVRLRDIEGTLCWITEHAEGRRFHLRCPALQYTRVVSVHEYELAWLMARGAVRALLKVKALER